MGRRIVERGEALAEIPHGGREFFKRLVDIGPHCVSAHFRALDHVEDREDRWFVLKSDIAVPFVVACTGSAWPV